MRSFIALSLFCLGLAAVPGDLVYNLPLAPIQPNKLGNGIEMYSGYLALPNSNGKQIHYVFFTSQGSPKNDPVLLWLNGGPGCSSMEGAFMENGPYVFSESEMKMSINPYSWNLNASMLYFEAPAGVGYSILGNIQNNYTNDVMTADDNLAALTLWFSKFPEFLPNKFYISGESYAGIYVPMLVQNVLDYNKNLTVPSNLTINIQGFLVGNGCTDWNVDADNAFAYFGWWHGLYGYDVWNTWVNNNCTAFSSLTVCVEAQSEMYALFTDINFYDIYRPCVFPDFGATHYAQFSLAATQLGSVVNCVPDIGLTKYLNRPDVRTALHINSNLGAWMECTNLDYEIDYATGSYYLYPSLVNSGLNIRIYSGDTDAAVPTIGTRQWINNLQMVPTKPWREWMFQGQVGGMVIDYTDNNFSFMTIRGTGHMSIQ